jgi:NAD(P)-dependent dehydrogenase (short-subunit alcohol dehydrogenase family)/NTP pyrophosphatase (non-canonical NTP hydrolase)
MDLDEMTAVVTGGAEGIGAGIARRLAAVGMHVVIADLDENAGQATAAQIGGSFVRANVATRAGIRTTIDTACQLSCRIGVLVNNAGGIEGPSFPTADPAKWEHTLDLNLRAVMLATQLVLAPMAEAGGGAVINIASVAGLGTTSHQSPDYAAAKAGVIRFTTCLAPLRDTIGVRANCICPDLVDTPASRRSRARMTPAELADLPPVLTPADIADAAMQFLADDTLAGRIMVCRGGQPSRLLPLTDWQTVSPVSARRPRDQLSRKLLQQTIADVERMVAKHGWASTPRRRMAMLLGEAMELADEVLQLPKAGEGDEEQLHRVGHEMYDVLWNLCDLARLTGIDIVQAAAEKRAINEVRTWPDGTG